MSLKMKKKKQTRVAGVLYTINIHGPITGKSYVSLIPILFPQAAISALKKQFGEESVLKPSSLINPAFLETEKHQNTIIRQSPNSTGAKNFRALVEEFLAVVDMEEKACG
ncbi:hypothetical protein [Desulfuromonas sp. AOP6]|uniref:hypothetical protein n=1 Tax=Desulfuromonas sp. AOP6 TaxID=1566351 RepID=UPI0012DF02B6|nr:hypothetical protein [Desulfuromonas sp. AOP6]